MLHNCSAFHIISCWKRQMTRENENVIINTTASTWAGSVFFVLCFIPTLCIVRLTCINLFIRVRLKLNMNMHSSIIIFYIGRKSAIRHFTLSTFSVPAHPHANTTFGLLGTWCENKQNNSLVSEHEVWKAARISQLEQKYTEHTIRIRALSYRVH